MTDIPRKRGRPPDDPETGPMTNAEKVRWHRVRQKRGQRAMALLLLDLWERQPEEWRAEQEYVHRAALALARKLAAKPED